MKLNNRVYDVLKWVALVLLPALAVLLSTVLPLYGVAPDILKAIVVTINALGVFIGALIGVSQITIANETAAEEFYETETEDEIPVDAEDIAEGES